MERKKTDLYKHHQRSTRYGKMAQDMEKCSNSLVFKET